MDTLKQEALLKAAELIAALAHEGQLDEDGIPYINHPRFVAGLLEDPEEKIVGFLHDVIEDTNVKESDLRPIFGDRITDAVVRLTRREGEPYFDYIRHVSENELARRVKLADLTHNMDMRRTVTVTERKQRRTEKYRKAYELLKNSDNETV